MTLIQPILMLYVLFVLSTMLVHVDSIDKHQDLYLDWPTVHLMGLLMVKIISYQYLNAVATMFLYCLESVYNFNYCINKCIKHNQSPLLLLLLLSSSSLSSPSLPSSSTILTFRTSGCSVFLISSIRTSSVIAIGSNLSSSVPSSM